MLDASSETHGQIVGPKRNEMFTHLVTLLSPVLVPPDLTVCSWVAKSAPDRPSPEEAL